MNKKLKDLIRNVKALEIARSHYLNLENEISRNENRLKVLQDELEGLLDEQEKLKSFTIYSLYKKLIHSHEHSLEMVKEHYLHKSLEYNEVLKDIQLLEYELDVLSQKFVDEGIVLSEFKAHLRAELKSLTHGKLKEYAIVIDRIEKNVSITKEIEEAIEAGVVLNRRINSVISFLSNETHQFFYNKGGQIIDILNVPQSKVDKYQQLIIRTKHAMMRFEAEMSDVYQHIFNDSSKAYDLGSDLLKEYKTNLLTDFKLKSSLFNSTELVRNLKSNVMGLTQSLRKDLKSLKKELLLLEDKEILLRKEI